MFKMKEKLTKNHKTKFDLRAKNLMIISFATLALVCAIFIPLNAINQAKVNQVKAQQVENNVGVLNLDI